MRRLSKMNIKWDNTKGLCLSVGSMKTTRAFSILEVIEFAVHRQNIRLAGGLR